MSLNISKRVSISDSEIEMTAVRSQGAGGQHVNKVSTAVQLRFNAAGSSSLSDGVRIRLKQIAGRRMTAEGMLIIKANRFRSQEQNRQDAVHRLVSLIQRAAEKPKHRRPTKPTAASTRRRLATKRRRSETKHRRKPILHTGDDS